jgi:hypothetical protein
MRTLSLLVFTAIFVASLGLDIVAGQSKIADFFIKQDLRTIICIIKLTQNIIEANRHAGSLPTLPTTSFLNPRPFSCELSGPMWAQGQLAEALPYRHNILQHLRKDLAQQAEILKTSDDDTGTGATIVAMTREILANSPKIAEPGIVLGKDQKFTLPVEGLAIFCAEAAEKLLEAIDGSEEIAAIFDSLDEPEASRAMLKELRATKRIGYEN